MTPTQGWACFEVYDFEETYIRSKVVFIGHAKECKNPNDHVEFKVLKPWHGHKRIYEFLKIYKKSYKISTLCKNFHSKQNYSFIIAANYNTTGDKDILATGGWCARHITPLDRPYKEIKRDMKDKIDWFTRVTDRYKTIMYIYENYSYK